MKFLDTQAYKGNIFQKSGPLDIKSFIKPTNTFQYLHRISAHSKSVFKGFIKGECIIHARNKSKIEKVPRGIRGEKSSKDMASSRNLVSTIGALASPKIGDGTRCPEG